LYTGAGGLDLGLETAGFQPVLCVEVDEDAKRTLALNRPNWLLANPGDIHQVKPTTLLRMAGLKPRQLTLLSGGPPCQPFSKSGYWSNGDALRLSDPRARTLHAYLDVVEVTLPQVLILENVKGLAYNGKNEGLQLLQEGIKAINRKNRTAYVPRIITLNAVDYGVPQTRERVFVVACIDGQEFVAPKPTHGDGSGLKPYLTAWDAIGEMDVSDWPDELEPRGKWAGLLP